MNFLPYSNAIKVSRFRSKPASDILSWILIGFAIGTTLGTYSILYIKHKNDLQYAADERSNQNKSLSRPKPIQTPIGAGVFSGWSRSTNSSLIQDNRVPATQKKTWLRAEISTYGLKYRRKGSLTSRGDRYDYLAFTAATAYKPGTKKPLFPFGSRWEVSYGGRSVIVKITDTGSYRPRRADYWLDLSCGAMAKLLGKPINPQKAYNTRIIARIRRID